MADDEEPEISKAESYAAYTHARGLVNELLEKIMGREHDALEVEMCIAILLELHARQHEESVDTVAVSCVDLAKLFAMQRARQKGN